ncbi:MAG: T9SS type A sorting domain-containing protein [Crocinitomicaceae bacterium]|nr:T9SS type A sorting domain-containing protein [Crocinitomicaceae bacterium]
MKSSTVFKLFFTLLFCIIYQFASAQKYQNQNLVNVLKIIKADCNSKYGSIVIQRSSACEITLWFTNREGYVSSKFQKSFSSVEMIDTIKNLELGEYTMFSDNNFNYDNDKFNMESYLDLKIGSTNKNIICGSKGTLLVAPLSKKYEWSTGDTTQTISVKNPGLVKLRVIETVDKYCSSEDSINLTLNPEINIEVLQSKSSCYADSTLVKYKITGGAKPYKISYQPNKTCFEGCLMPTDTVKYLGYWPHGYFLYLKDSLNCYSEKVFYLTPNSSQLKLAYTKNTILCEGDSMVYDDKYPNDDKFIHQWYRNGQPIPEATSSTFSTKLVGSYHVVITTPDCVIYSDTNNLTISTRQPLQCIIPENANCLGVPVTYQAPTGKSNYIWYFSDLKYNVDYQILDGGNYFSNKLVVKWLTVGEKRISFNYSNAGCNAKEPMILKSNVISPVHLISLSPTQMQICQGSEFTYKIKNSNQITGGIQSLNLKWEIPGAIEGVDYQIISSLDNEMTINWLKSAQYKLVVFNLDSNSFCDGNNLIKFDVSVNPIEQPTLIADKGMVCLGNVIEYKTEAGKQNYQWIIPNKTKDSDYILIEGGDEKSKSMKIKWLSQGYNQVSVNYTSVLGLCNSNNPAIIGTQVHIPFDLVPVTSEKTDVCLNSIVTYKVKNLNSSISMMNLQNLSWTVIGDPSRDYKVLEGGNATDSSITVQWLKPAKTGVFVNTNDCGKSINFDVNVHDTINFIQLIAELPVNLCNIDSLKIAVPNLGTNTIQWYYNDQEIKTAIDTFLYAKFPGKYNIVIKNAGNCTFTSDYYDFKKDTCNSSLAVIENKLKDLILVYPNPASTILKIDIKDDFQVKSISLINLVGQEVMSQDLKGIKKEINVQDVLKGIYFVTFFDEQNEIISSQKITIE